MSMTEVIQQMGQHTNMLPRERGVTLPLVSFEDGSIIVRRLYYFTRSVPGQGMHITDPQYVATVNWTTGQFIGVKEFTAQISDVPDPPWIHTRPSYESPDDIIPEFSRIWALYDVLIPAFQSGDDSETIRAAAEQYEFYFHRHAEGSLLPYYSAYSGQFLTWVRSLNH